MRVARQESHIVKFLRDLDHSKGEVNFLRSGCGGDSESDLAEMMVEGWGSGVSKVK